MTEDEAKTKWCPFYKIYASGHYTLDNRAPNDHPLPGQPEPFARYRCIASACMAWRGTYEYQGNATVFMKDGSGYCGLAGRP